MLDALEKCKSFNPDVTMNLDEFIRGIDLARDAFREDHFFPVNGEMSQDFRTVISSPFDMIFDKAKNIQKEIQQKASKAEVFKMAATGATKRTAQELDVDTSPLKHTKIKDNKYTFTHDPKNLIINFRMEHEKLSSDEQIAGFCLTHAQYSQPHLNMYSVAALAHTSTNSWLVQWRQQAIEALDGDCADAVVFEANTMLAERLRKKVISAVPQTAIFKDPKNPDDPSEDGFSFLEQPFFQGTKLVLKPSEATSDDEAVCVPLDKDGICKFKTFLDTICGLKVGTPYNDKILFTVSSTKALQGAGEDEGGAVVFYEWE